MKKLLVFLLLLMLQQAGISAQTIDQEWFKKNYTKLEQYITMRDGVKLFTSIYLPKDSSEKHPILMTRTPYSCAPYGNEYRNFTSNHYREYLKEGYILVYQDVRGRWMSESEFEDVRPYLPNKRQKTDIDETTDTYDTVEWLVKNLKQNNGNVGVFGISYPGFYSSMAAASGHPAIKAVSPQAPVTDWFMGDDFHHNGAFFLMDAFSFYSGFGKPRPAPTTSGPKGFDFPHNDAYRFYLEQGTLANLTRLTGDSIRFWKQMMEHPNYDSWWQARDARKALFQLKPTMLIVGGLFDAEDCYGAWNTYKAIEKQSPGVKNNLVMGPWFHGQWARGNGSSLGNVRFGSKTSEWYAENIEIPFFNYYLKGKGSEPKIAEATIFYTGINKWRQHDTWPPAGVDETPLYFANGGKLSFSAPSETSGETRYVSDPSKPVPFTPEISLRRSREYMTEDQRFASRRPDVVVFQTEVLEEDLTLAGPVLADLRVKLSTTDADFVVKLIDVFPDTFEYPSDWPLEENASLNYPMGGYQMLVRGEIMRGRFRNSFEKPEAFVPGKIETVRFQLPDVAHTFRKGHRLMIQVQSSWFPLVDRNPQQFVNVYTCTEKDFIPSEIRIQHNSGAASAVVLPVLK